MDARALTEPVDREAVRAYARANRTSGISSGTIIAIVVGAVFIFLFAGVLTTAVSIFASLQSGVGMLGAAVPVIAILIAVGAVVAIVVAATRRANDRRYRLDAFARANAMTYVPSMQSPALPGMIFGVGSGRQSSDLVRGTQPRFVEFGNYRYTTGSGKNRSTHNWGYVAVRLDVPLPHIVLDAVGNNALFGSNLPISLDADQRLSLEGDFDRHFSLYCPSGYERDALYLFTPDIMARFIDNAAALDVEIVDDWLFLYAKRDFSTLDPRMWGWLFSVVGALLDKLAQWARWRDERLAETLSAAPAASVDAPAVGFAAPAGMLRPPPGVAAPGRRLRRGVPWVTFVITGAVVLFWILGQSGVWTSLFGSLLGR